MRRRGRRALSGLWFFASPHQKGDRLASAICGWIQLATHEGVLPRIGGTGKHRDVRIDTFELAPDEFITGLSVKYWNYIDRLIFRTNKRSYGPFGGAGGRVRKELNAPPGRSVAGFMGRHWNWSIVFS